MAFDDLETARAKRSVENFLDQRRPPPAIRDEIDLDYRIDVDNQSVEIHEIRPDFEDPDDELELPVAKVTYVRSRNLWRLYWMQSDGNWHRYDPADELETLERAWKVVDEDELGCFWG
ncbi:MAG: DUF3024 domain-containing protein [Bradymonadaceae bacterium]